MDEINTLNIPAYQRKRSLAAKSAAGKKLRIQRKQTKTEKVRKIRSYERPTELSLTPTLSSVNQFPNLMEEIEEMRSVKESKVGFREMKTCGRCEGYFDKIDVAVIKVTNPIRTGDIIIFEKDEGLFEQEITSMQIDRKEVQLARSGSDIGLKVVMKPKVGTQVYKVI
jgi:hypothetical protein